MPNEPVHPAPIGARQRARTTPLSNRIDFYRVFAIGVTEALAQ